MRFEDGTKANRRTCTVGRLPRGVVGLWERSESVQAVAIRRVRFGSAGGRIGGCVQGAFERVEGAGLIAMQLSVLSSAGSYFYGTELT